MKRIYLDYAATTPMDKKVVEAMKPYFSDVFGNAGSLHSFGQEASAAVFKARRKIADILGVHYSTIIFTGSATEANNLALQGCLLQAIGTRQKAIAKTNVVVSAIEHESVMDTAKNLDAELRVVPVFKNGQVDLKKLEKAIDKNTVLVSIIYANNEIGAVQDIRKIADMIARFRSNRSNGINEIIVDGKTNTSSTTRTTFTTRPWPLFHTDAVQAFQYLDCKPEELGVDLMTLSAHKIYGPKGIGLLYVRNKRNNRSSGINENASTDTAFTSPTPLLHPLIYGGGQENGLRSGTENVASIIGFARAIEIADKEREKETKRICDLRDWFLKELVKIFPSASLNGQKRWRLPNNISLNLKGISNEEAMTFLDLNGVALSAGSACSARSLEPSKTLLAIGLSEKEARSSLRITLGRQTKKEELKQALKVFKAMKKALI
ncbi:MAG: cysteine desulfurase family protein [bacterium]|nr:cysteine desulfurase family protein [bacterium]